MVTVVLAILCGIGAVIFLVLAAREGRR